jgi:hypothetical protein
LNKTNTNELPFVPGQSVIYYKDKKSTSPSANAKEVRPQRSGEDYTYTIKKYWVVSDIEEHDIVVMTRRGKKNRIPRNDPRLRRANLLERFIHKERFPILEKASQE